MRSSADSSRAWEEFHVNIKLKLAALWAAVMFVYIYVDIYGFYQPGEIESILDGKVGDFDVTQAWAVGALILLAIPGLMVFLSTALTARINRWTNIIVAIIYILVAVFNPIGETWVYIWLGSAIEIALLALIVWYSWNWPRVDTNSRLRA